MNETHQVLIDGLSALVLTGRVRPHRARAVVDLTNTLHPQDPTVDHRVLYAIRIEAGLSDVEACRVCLRNDWNVRPVQGILTCRGCGNHKRLED